LDLVPVFILCLLFALAKLLFQKWLFCGIATMFSMAALSAMVTIAAGIMIRLSASFLPTPLAHKHLLGDLASSDGMTSQATMQGGVGLILTTLTLSAPNCSYLLPRHFGWFLGRLPDCWPSSSGTAGTAGSAAGVVYAAGA